MPEPLTDLSTPAPAGVTLTTDPTAIAETGAALDALFATAVPDPDKPLDPPAPKPGEPAAPAAPTPPEPKPTEPSAPSGTPPVPKPGEATPPAPAPVAKDEFDKVELPPHTKPATAQSFDALKKTARERVAAVEKEREDLKTKLAALEARPAVDPKVEQELTELRAFRQRLDVEADPAFKEYVEEISRNEESIFAKLKEAGAGDAVVAKIKEIGIKDLDWETVLEKLPPVARRYIENKLAVNEDLGEQRMRALADAKKNAGEFLAQREKENLQNEIVHRAAADEHFTKVAPQLPWFKLETIPATATPEDKAALEAHNKFFTETSKAAKEMLEDNSPQMRAIATLGYVQMLRLQKEIPAIHAEYAAEQKKLTDEVTALKAQVKEKDDFIARIKNSSKTSLRDGNAPIDPKTAAAQPTFGEHGSSALDRLREQQLAGS